MITVKKFAFNPYQVNAYVLYDETKECLLIDPGVYFSKEIELLENFISENNIIPVKILNTHSHFDHVLGNGIVSKKYNIKIYLHKDDTDMYKNAKNSADIYGMSIEQPPLPDGFIDDGEIIKFGNSEIKAIKAPGHSPGSLLYYSENQKFVIAGDVLFNGSIGRTDLPLGDTATLLKSISEKLMVLDDNIKVYCGHGPDTTIGMERKMNPFINGEFV